MGIEMVENVGEQDKQGISRIIRHFCKVCNRGFGCAGALGGHMRAHVIMGDVSNEHNHNNPPLPPRGDHEKPEQSNNKHSYFLRAKTPRFMGYHVSDYEDGEYLRKSSSLPFVKFALDKERVSPLLSSPRGSKSQHFDHHEYNSASSEEEDLANCLVMLSNNKSCKNNNEEENKAKEAVSEKGMFQCKACKKVFNSHQALGGHRASHKKVKGCFAAKMDIIGPLNDEFDEEQIQEDHQYHHEPDVIMTPSSAAEPTSTTTSNTRKARAKMHECSVCRRVFSSGQALGGHKRCHWLTTSTDNAFIPNFHDFQYDHHHHHHQSQQIYKKPMLTNPHHHERDHDNHHDYNHDLDLNLNLPANVGDSHDTRFYLQKLTDHSQQKVETDNGGQKGSCEMKLRKLSDLRDVNLDGGWLQVGIASTTDIY